MKLSSFDYYLDFFITPIFIIAAFILSAFIGPTVGWAVAIVFGIVLWSFLEYSVHRWVLHGDIFSSLEEAHMDHHMRPDDKFGWPSWITIIAELILFGILISFGIVGLGIYIGLLLGYMCYVFMHDMTHDNLYSRKCVALHESHHYDNSNLNFGVITSFWDRIFNTYNKKGK